MLRAKTSRVVDARQFYAHVARVRHAGLALAGRIGAVSLIFGGPQPNVTGASRAEPAETLYIRRTQNGIERPGGLSCPAPGHLASLVVADAFAGALTRGSIRTFPATAETENTASYQGGAWLGDLDSNQD